MSGKLGVIDCVFTIKPCDIKRSDRVVINKTRQAHIKKIMDDKWMEQSVRKCDFRIACLVALGAIESSMKAFYIQND